MTLVKPSNKPLNPNFSSGPCAKRPGWSIDVLKNTPTGRSHRSKECKAKLNEVIVKSKKVLGLPEKLFTWNNDWLKHWSLRGCYVVSFRI